LLLDELELLLLDSELLDSRMELWLDEDWLLELSLLLVNALVLLA